MVSLFIGVGDQKLGLDVLVMLCEWSQNLIMKSTELMNSNIQYSHYDVYNFIVDPNCIPRSLSISTLYLTSRLW